MKMVNDVNPDFEALSHHGVRGMKWGVRKNGSHPSNSAIKTARKNVEVQRRAITKQKRKAFKETVKRSSRAPHERAKLKDMKLSLLKNPDRVTAMKMTKGESIAHVLLTAHEPALGAAIVVREAAVRTVAKRQRTGAYDKKK